MKIYDPEHLKILMYDYITLEHLWYQAVGVSMGNLCHHVNKEIMQEVRNQVSHIIWEKGYIDIGGQIRNQILQLRKKVL